ncbi:MAG: acyl-CoA-binding protein [Cellulophaga sp.]
MIKDKLKADFIKAVDFATNYSKPLPPDLMLKFYAYYKIANENISSPENSKPLINAFKANALIQAGDISPEKAMKSYIKLVKFLKEKE